MDKPLRPYQGPHDPPWGRKFIPGDNFLILMKFETFPGLNLTVLRGHSRPVCTMNLTLQIWPQIPWTVHWHGSRKT